MNLLTSGIAEKIFTDVIAEVISGDNNFSLKCYSPLLKEEIILTTGKLPLKSTFKTVYEFKSLLNYEIGDILLINTTGSIYNLFRSKSLDNSLFVTDRCNSNCLMCSQPPKNKDDIEYFFNINTQLIKMLPKTIKELGVTGGEPTLMGVRFIELLKVLTLQLPDTNIHVLTNGRLFAWKNIPKAIYNIGNRNIVFGIPLYSDFFQDHDYIVQSKNAFNQTVLGLHNLARYNIRVEIRIVLHKLTFKRLNSLAKFIYKNLPFVEHIAFMGLEYTGYTPKNNDLLWIEPNEYSDELEESVIFLDSMDMNVSIYNLQLCLIKPTLWKYTRNSISDWKKDYLEECNKCSVLNDCGGIFATSKKQSSKIKAIP
jgi:His-Xaa-Ser system radical SAM maturase HxsC